MKKILNHKIFKWIIRFIQIFFVMIILSYIILILIQRVSSKSIKGYYFFTVATGSMAGVYDINDVIIVKEWNTNQLKVGDDIAYIGEMADMAGKTITHRIIKIEDDSNGEKLFITKGVKAELEDYPIRANQIVGKVVGKVPIITQINHIVKTQVGYFCIIFVPLVFIIVIEILQTITDYKLEKNEIKRIKE